MRASRAKALSRDETCKTVVVLWKEVWFLLCDSVSVILCMGLVYLILALCVLLVFFRFGPVLL